MLIIAVRQVLNSHCDGFSNKCKCNRGYFYDSTENRCRIFDDKIGEMCDNDSECRKSDANSECNETVCQCKRHFTFNFLTNRCEVYEIDVFICALGYTYDKTLDKCQLSPNPKVETSFFEIIIIIGIGVFLFMAIFYCLPFLSTEQSQTLPSDSELSERADPIPHNDNRDVRQNVLRNNSHTLQPLNSSNHIFITFPVLIASALETPSLPVNPSAPPDESEPPPYHDELPTYEEALDLSPIHK